jgi:hypothetical protein
LILHEAHDSAYSTHSGSTKKYHDLKNRYWWYGMKRAMAEYVEFAEAVSQKRVCTKVFHDSYKGLHPALKMKSFSSSLSLRQIPVCGPAMRSLDLPLVTTIGISGRGGGVREWNHLQTDK